jgi:aspartyl-tRNA(Asn)/glutamyl-tRNA(Gln) amidotransferase subunit B
MRSKEEANDYRYFPDPDLLPLEIDQIYIDTVAGTLPELPDQKAQRFIQDYGLSAYDAGVLTASAEFADYYEVVVQELSKPPPVIQAAPKLAANTVIGELSGLLNRDGVEIGESRVNALDLAGLLKRVADNTISGKIAKDVLEVMWDEGAQADAIIEARGLRQITDESAIERAIEAVMAANPGQLADYRAGKEKLFGFFVGQVMKATAGKANPARLNELLKKKLGG